MKNSWNSIFIFISIAFVNLEDENDFHSHTHPICRHNRNINIYFISFALSHTNFYEFRSTIHVKNSRHSQNKISQIITMNFIFHFVARKDSSKMCVYKISLKLSKKLLPHHHSTTTRVHENFCVIFRNRHRSVHAEQRKKSLWKCRVFSLILSRSSRDVDFFLLIFTFNYSQTFLLSLYSTRSSSLTRVILCKKRANIHARHISLHSSFFFILSYFFLSFSRNSPSPYRVEAVSCVLRRFNERQKLMGGQRREKEYLFTVFTIYMCDVRCVTEEKVKKRKKTFSNLIVVFFSLIFISS